MPLSSLGIFAARVGWSLVMKITNINFSCFYDLINLDIDMNFGYIAVIFQ